LYFSCCAAACSTELSDHVEELEFSTDHHNGFIDRVMFEQQLIVDAVMYSTESGFETHYTPQQLNQLNDELEKEGYFYESCFIGWRIWYSFF
jgi:hypothetical protein